VFRKSSARALINRGPSGLCESEQRYDGAASTRYYSAHESNLNESWVPAGACEKNWHAGNARRFLAFYRGAKLTRIVSSLRETDRPVARNDQPSALGHPSRCAQSVRQADRNAGRFH